MSMHTPREETTERRVVRLTLGVGTSLLLTQLFPWPVSFVMPLFVAMLLQEPRPIAYGAGLGALVQASLAMGIGYVVAVVLAAYPLIAIAVLLALLWRLYVFMLTSGTSMIALVGAIIGLLVVPVLVPISPELAQGVAIGLSANLLVAFGLAQIAFLLIPARAFQTPEPKPAPPPEIARSLALKMTVAMGPIMVVFLLYGLTDILLLSIAAMTALGMGGNKSWEMGMNMVIANLFLGGIAMLVAYQFLVIAPSPIILGAVIFAASWVFARGILGGGPHAALWATALNGFLLLLGSLLGTEDPASFAKLIDRVGQFLAATLYVALAFQVVDLCEGLANGWRANRRAT